MPPPHGLESVFKDLFAREYERLCRYAYTYMQDEHMAEDVVQETFIKIWEQKKELISSSDIKFYLITAVRNNCISVLRKQKSQRTTFTDNTPEPDPEPFFTERQHHDRANDDARRISEALNQLPPKCKEVFLLVKMQGMSYKQAAETLGISVKTIENQMGKAIKVLRDFVVGQTAALVWLLFLVGNL
ncbi:MAG: polymerase, sigma-24 subunit, subfamily [Flavipsychrobacter sp.]|jgi:RNA polymerase sigma-70 factor (ECF subfamily)|nr:polymerase, sigma-24 subunit, subfamily [Flavipsychrobacter sp.]